MSKDFLDICRSSSQSVFSTFIEVVLICVINSNDNGHPTFISNRKKRHLRCEFNATRFNKSRLTRKVINAKLRTNISKNYVQVGKDQSEPHCKTKHKSRTNLSTNGSEFHANFNI